MQGGVHHDTPDIRFLRLVLAALSLLCRQSHYLTVIPHSSADLGMRKVAGMGFVSFPSFCSAESRTFLRKSLNCPSCFSEKQGSRMLWASPRPAGFTLARSSFPFGVILIFTTLWSLLLLVFLTKPDLHIRLSWAETLCCSRKT